ncbi:MAG: hypothetical protein M3014_01060 [Chloroflexota bacterium]|nr:hypothetical protein [Chloroflexota bacterium]
MAYIVRKAVEADAAGMASVLVTSFRSARRGQLPDERLYALTHDGCEQSWRSTQADGKGNHRLYVFVAEERRPVLSGGPTRDPMRLFGVAQRGPERTFYPAGTGELYVLYLLPERQR